MTTPDPLVLRASIQDGLLFNIVPSIRWIFFHVEKTKMVLNAAFDKEPLENEKEMLIDAVAEASGHFDENFEIEVQCYYEPSRFEEVTKKGYLVFARFEEE